MNIEDENVNENKHGSQNGTKDKYENTLGIRTKHKS